MTGSSPAKPPRLAVICDFPEEGWPSMDLVAEMLLAQLTARHADRLSARRVCPPFRRHLGRIRKACPAIDRQPAIRNFDRLLNRHWDYPRFLRGLAREYEVFHLCDHSYGQLLHELPAASTGVFCHDLDTFRCLLTPEAEPRPRWFKWMARRSLTGLQKAAVVFYTTESVRQQIEHHGLLDPGRLVKATLGVSPEFSPRPLFAPPPNALEILSRLDRYLLHVGSCIPRKRIDVLLEVFATVRQRHPGLRLVQVGGTWTDAQVQQIHRLGVDDSVMQVRGLDRAGLAEMYRRAAAVLVTSDAEGFGLPMIEALACGAAVVASELPVLREVGGNAATYQKVGDVPSWAAQVDLILTDPQAGPQREERSLQAARFSWQNHADVIANAYSRLLQRAADQATGPQMHYGNQLA